MFNNSSSATLKIAIIGSFASLCWGMNYVALKLVSNEMPAFLILTLRVILTTLLLLPFTKLPKSDLKRIFFFSLSQYILCSGLCTLGTALTNGSIGSLVTQLSIPFSFILSWVYFKEKLLIKQLLGCIISFIGLAILIGISEVPPDLLGIVILSLGGFFSALASMQVKKLKHHPLLGVMCLASLLAIPQALILSLFLENNHWEHLRAVSLKSYLAITFIVISSFGANYLWNRLIRDYPISTVIPYGLLVPIFGVILSIFALDEPLTLSILVGGIIIIIGISVLTLQKRGVPAPAKELI